jgi:SAM-dependent methyltransferase
MPEDRLTFDGMVWGPGHLHWHGLSFSLDPKDPGATELVLWKTPALIAQYEAFWAHEAGRVERVFELGLWKGGSMAFWAEAFSPTRLVGVDKSLESPSAAFDHYLAGRADRLHVYWGVDQGDPERLEALVATEFDGPLDLVIDDASHLYSLTLSSLETLLPRLRPGGLYIVEDWAWHHWPALRGAFSCNVPLTRLVTELIETVGTGRGVIADVSVYQGFVAVRPPLVNVGGTRRRAPCRPQSRPRSRLVVSEEGSVCSYKAGVGSSILPPPTI